MQVFFEKSGIDDKTLQQHVNMLEPPTLNTLQKDTAALQLAKKISKPEHLVIIGIGGSNLGTQAVHEAILGKNHPNVHYADTVDSDNISNILHTINAAAKKGKVLINAITKSGTTTETVANFQIFFDFLKKHDKNYKKHVVITTDDGSPLQTLAVKQGFQYLTIPDIPGRYTVFTPVSTFPLAMMGLNVQSLYAGAKNASHSVAKLAASIQYEHFLQGKNISDLFIFSPDLESLGKWWRQLTAESLGKNGKGITPTVSIGSTDLHSMTQLALDGPRDKYTTFVAVKKNHTSLRVPVLKDTSLPYLQNKSLQFIMQAIYQATIFAYAKKKLPFTELQFSDKSEESVGEFLQTKMFETQYLAQLLKINPFDQPAVEEYKKKTRELLA